MRYIDYNTWAYILNEFGGVLTSSRGAGLPQKDGWMCVSLLAQLCWQKAENDDLLGELLFTPCPGWIKIKLEVYELRCLSWHLYEPWARLALIYVYSSKGRGEKNKWSSLKSYSNALSTTAHTHRGMMGDREESQVKKMEEVLRLHSIATDNIYRNIYYF